MLGNTQAVGFVKHEQAKLQKSPGLWGQGLKLLSQLAAAAITAAQ
jgi:hypothetical protein